MERNVIGDVVKLAGTLAVIAAIIGLCVLNLRCGGDPEPGSAVSRVSDELREGRRAQRIQGADNLAVAARNLRVLARRYLAEGERRKAQRAINTAQELDKRIRKLREQP